MLLLSLLAGCSICWFNTVCYVLCIRNFPANRALALSLSISFNGVSASIYNLIANSIDPHDNKLYLLLNAIIPLITSLAALPPIIHRSPPEDFPPDPTRRSPTSFLFLTALAIITGLYLLFLNPISSSPSIARVVLSGAIFLLVLPLVTPAMVYAWEWAQNLEGSSLRSNNDDDLEAHKELMGAELSSHNDFSDSESNDDVFHHNALFNNQTVVLGEEHSTRVLILKWDFWLYYVTYLCGGTLGLVYSNNLGQISESLGYGSDISSLVSLYSACSFFGRLLSTTPDFLRR